MSLISTRSISLDSTFKPSEWFLVWLWLVKATSSRYFDFAANEGLVRIQYKCLVPIYVFSEIKLCSLVVSKTEL